MSLMSGRSKRYSKQFKKLFSPLFRLESFLEVSYNDFDEEDFKWASIIQNILKIRCYAM